MGPRRAPKVTGALVYFPLRPSSSAGGRTTRRPSRGMALSSMLKPEPSLWGNAAPTLVQRLPDLPLLSYSSTVKTLRWVAGADPVWTFIAPESEAMVREYGSVKAPSADGSWNKWAVDIDWRRQGAESPTAISGSPRKPILRATVNPLRCAIRASRKPRVAVSGHPLAGMRVAPGGCGQNFVFCTPRLMDLRGEQLSRDRRPPATSLQSSSRPR